MNPIYEFLNSKKNDMVSLLQQLVEMESPSTHKQLGDSIAQQLAECFQSLTGGRTEIFEQDKFGNHIRGEWGKGSEQILLLGHYDTVWQPSQLENMPFLLKDGKAYGPGTVDMKASLVQGLYALHALEHFQTQMDTKIVFLFTSDEEIGSPSSRDLIIEESKKSKCVLVLESTTYPVKKIITSRRGVGIYHLKITGQSAHAANMKQEGISAIEELAKQIQFIYSLNNQAALISLNVGKIKGGTTFNVIADYAEADIDLRFLKAEDGHRLNELLLNLTPILKGISIEVSGGINRWPFEHNEQSSLLFEWLKETAKSSFGMTLEETLSGGFSDANISAHYAPTIDGIGCVGAGHHALHEHAIVSDMPLHSALLAQFLIDLERRSNYGLGSGN